MALGAAEAGRVVTTGTKAELPDNLRTMPEEQLADFFIGDVASLPVDDEKRREVRGYVELVSDLLEQGRLVPNRVRLLEGLSAAKMGIQDVADGKVSGEKLVVKVA